MRIILYSFVLLFLILFPADTAAHAMQAMRIWSENIVPFLFPYMLFSRLLYGQLRSLSLCTIPVTITLSLLGGSPTGAMLVASSASKLSQRNLYALCMLCASVSPMFITGTLRELTGNTLLCSLLLGSHWLSCVLCACTVWLFCRPESSKASVLPENIPPGGNPIAQSIDAIMQVGGCIICYSVLSGMLVKVLHAANTLAPFFHAALEISGGAHAIWQSSFSANTKAVLLSAVLGFNGLSILSQNHTYLRPLGITMPRLISFAVLRAFCSAVCMALMLSLNSA